MSSRENLEISNQNSLFHLNQQKSSSSMMPAIQRSKRKLRKRRVIVSIILLLPALAAIIGIVAWAISVEVAKSNEINSSPAANHHRKLHRQQSNYQQLFKRNRAPVVAEQPVAAAVIAPLSPGKSPASDEQWTSNSKRGSNGEQQHVTTSTSRKRVLAPEEQMAAAQDKKSESGQRSSTLLLTNLEQVGVLTSGLSSSSRKENDRNEYPEVETTTSNSLSADDHHHELSLPSLNSRNDTIKQLGPKKHPLNLKTSAKEETQTEEEEDKRKQRNSNKSKLGADPMKKPIKFLSSSPSVITESEHNENQQQASKTDSSAPWKEDYLMKQDSALAKKQRFIKLEDDKTGSTHQVHRVEGAQYTIIINNNKQPTVNTNAREAASITDYETTTEQSPVANNNNNNNNNNVNDNDNANNGGNSENLPVDMNDDQSTGINLETKTQADFDQKERDQDELSFEAIASAISTSLNAADSQHRSSSSPESLEGDTGTLDQTDEGKGNEQQVGVVESRWSTAGRRTTGQNVAEVIDHIVEHRKAQQGLAPNLKGPQIVVVAPVVGSMMKASRSLTRVSGAEESKTDLKKQEVNEDKRISSSMKKDAIILAQERKFAKQQTSSSSLIAKRLLRTKPLGARLLGISMPAGDKGDLSSSSSSSSSSSPAAKNDGQAIKFSERVQVIEDDDSSPMLALNLQDNDNNNHNNDIKDKNTMSLAASVELITAPSEQQFKRSWATHEGDQGMLDELSSNGSGNSNALSSEQLALEDRLSIHVASQSGQPRHRTPRHGAAGQFDPERYQQQQQQAQQASSPLQYLQYQQQKPQQPARLYSAEQLIREHMLKAMSKAADRTNSSTSPTDGANSSNPPAPSESGGQVKVSPSTSGRPPVGNNKQPNRVNELSGSPAELTNEQLADDSSNLTEKPSNDVANNKEKAQAPTASPQKQTNILQVMESQQVNRYQQQQQQLQHEQQSVRNQLPVFADQEYNVPAHMAESVIHNLEQSPVSMFDGQQQQQQQLAKGQVPLLRYYHQQQFNNLPLHLQRQIINHQQTSLQAAASQQHPFFLPVTRWQQQQAAFRQQQPAALQFMVANQQLGRSSSGAADVSASLSEQPVKSTRSNPTMALRQLFSSMRHRSSAVAAAPSISIAHSTSSSSSSPSAVAASSSLISSYSPSLSTRSGKEDLLPVLQQQQQQVKLSPSVTSSVQDQEAQDSYGQMPVYHMMGGPADQHYAPQPHYQSDYNDNDKKSKGITFHFGGGPIGGGTQLITSPMGIFKHLMIPLLPNPRVNLNGKVVFGVVLEKSTAFGEPKKKYKFWG